MMHPLLHLVATQPQLLADHADAYAELLAAELGLASSVWKKRALLSALSLCSLGVAITLAGVGWMLWAALPASQMQAPWVLWIAPLVALAISIACYAAANTRTLGMFTQVKRQLKADLTMLREMRAS